MHGDGVRRVHEDVRHAHQVLNGLQLQAQQVPVKGLPADGLWKGALSEQELRAHRAPLPSSEACGSNTSSIHWSQDPRGHSIQAGEPSLHRWGH